MSTCDVVVVDTKKIKEGMKYYEGISNLVRAMRQKSHVSARILIKEPMAKLLVLLIDDKPVSMLRIFKEKNLFNNDYVEYINLVITLPEYRQKGYSRLLFLWLFENYKTNLNYALEVESDKKILVDFYESLGFVKIGETEYNGVMVDCMIKPKK